MINVPIEFSEQTSREWFGLAEADGTMLLSIISPYERVLSEDEFVNLPMTFEENDQTRQNLLRREFSRFFQNYIGGISELIWSGDQFASAPVASIETHLEKFLCDGESQQFIDRQNAILYETQPYLEIHVFSVKKFLMFDSSTIFQRLANQRIGWKDTNWY